MSCWRAWDVRGEFPDIILEAEPPRTRSPKELDRRSSSHAQRRAEGFALTTFEEIASWREDGEDMVEHCTTKTWRRSDHVAIGEYWLENCQRNRRGGRTARKAAQEEFERGIAMVGRWRSSTSAPRPAATARSRRTSGLRHRPVAMH